MVATLDHVSLFGGEFGVGFEWSRFTFSKPKGNKMYYHLIPTARYAGVQIYNIVSSTFSQMKPTIFSCVSQTTS